jgi:hypothetical protein
MAPRPRLASATLVLSAALVFSLVGVLSLGASLKAGGKVVSASLTKTSFPASQAGTVKLVYKFSPASSRFGYLLSLKKGAKWVKVQSVNKKGSFKGSYKMTVKKLFGSKSVQVGQYRVKVSADANSVRRSFRVVETTPPPGAFSKASPGNGATGQALSVVLSWASSSKAASYEYCVDTTDNNACDGSWVSTGSATSNNPSGLVFDTAYYWQVRAKNASGTTDADSGSWFSFRTSGPLAGHWTGSAGPSPFAVDFYVSPDQTKIIHFGFKYALACVTEGWILDGTQRSIESKSFSANNYGVIYSGTFDSTTGAHGTVNLTDFYIGCPAPDVYVTAGPYSWTATWQDASQPS